MLELTKCCANCEYWCYEEYSQGYVCVNRASDNVADFMEADDCCYEFEEKEKLTRDEILKMLIENAEESKRLISKLKEVDAMDG